MNPAVRPIRFLTIVLLATSAAGTLLLAQPWASAAAERERTFYGSRLLWRAAFEAVSATCGSGLRTGAGHAAFTPAGERVRLGCAIVGGLGYLCAALTLYRRIGLPVAGLGTTLLMLGALGGLLIWHQAIYTPEWLRPTAWEEWAMCFALGWELPDSATPAWVRLIFFALVAACGPAALGLLREPGQRRTILIWLGGLAAWLMVVAGLLALADGPRGRGPSRISAPPIAERVQHTTVEVLLAAGPGVARGRPEEPARALRQTLLALVVLVGGLPGSFSGGITFPLLVLALTGGWAAWRGARLRPGPRAGIAVVLACGLWTGIVALGLLLLEHWTASGYQSPPTLSDALLEAASAVGGAALTSGLTATLTDANLSSGMYQNVDLYPYGMTWLMLALLVGKLLPLAVLARFTADHAHQAPTTPRPVAPGPAAML